MAALMHGGILAWALGAIVGLILALTGAGGGVLAVPLLIFGLHLPIQEASPVGLLAVGVASLLGALMGLRDGVVRYRAASVIGLTGMVVAPLGVWLAHRLPAQPLMLAFAVVLAWTAWRMSGLGKAPLSHAETPPPCQVNPQQGRLRWTPPCALALGGTGAISGLLSGLLGVGGGFVIVPSLTRFSNLDALSIATTSLGVIAIVAVGGITAASHYGSLNLAVALPFGAGATLALLGGRSLARKLSPKMLQRAFAVVSALVALLMVARGLGWLKT